MFISFRISFRMSMFISSRFISFRIDWFEVLAIKETFKIFYSMANQFFSAQPSFMVQLSHPYITHINSSAGIPSPPLGLSVVMFPYITTGKTISLIICTFVSKMMSLLLNMLSRSVKASLPKSKHLSISGL